MIGSVARVALVGSVVCAVSVLAGCDSGPADTPPTDTPSTAPAPNAERAAEPSLQQWADTPVAVVGDSLTEQASRALTERVLARGLRNVTIDAEWGRSLSAPGFGRRPGLEALGRLAGDFDPRVWLIALGTNDAALVPAARWEADIRAALALMGTNDTVVWITPSVATSDNGYGRHAVDMTAFADLLSTIAATDDRLRIVDWQPSAATPGVLGSDGVHLTAAGIERRVDVMVDAIADALAS